MNIVENYKTLKKAHVICELCTRRYKARFAFTKSELLYLTKNHKRFDIVITIKIKNIIKRLMIIAKILKMQVDIKIK